MNARGRFLLPMDVSSRPLLPLAHSSGTRKTGYRLSPFGSSVKAAAIGNDDPDYRPLEVIHHLLVQ